MAKAGIKKNESVEHVPITRLHRNPWGLEVGPPLSSEDYELLRLSIKKDGIQIPLIVWRRGKRLVVLSGSNRLRIARELGIKSVPVIIRQFADQNAAKAFAVCDNLARRQLTTGQRAYLALPVPAASHGRKGEQVGLARTFLKSSNLRKVDAWQTAADKAGVSEGSLVAMKSIVEYGDDELLQSVLRGEVAVTAAARYVKMEARTARLPDPGGNGKPTSGTVCTVIHGDSSDLIEQVARLYLRPGDVIYDVTVGQSVFWQSVNLHGCKFFGTDIAMKPPVDLRKLPYKDCSATIVVLDPPHQHDVGVPMTGARYNARRTVRRCQITALRRRASGGMACLETWRGVLGEVLR